MELKIVHISDVHILDWRFERRIDTRKKASKIIETIIDNEDPAKTVVIDTGDVMQDGGDSEVREAWKVYRPLRKAGFRVMICKGNHDTGWSGLIHQSSASDAFHAFANALCGFTHDDWPIIRRWREVLFVSANTSWDQTLLARGRVGEEQRQSICEAVKIAHRHNYRTVLALHHCPSGGSRTKRLSDRYELEEELNSVGGVDLMLTGHLHRARNWRNKRGARRLICSPPSGEFGRYRRIWFDEDGNVEWEWFPQGSWGVAWDSLPQGSEPLRKSLDALVDGETDDDGE